MTRTIRLFASAKGGVGKSTLAVASARWLAAHGECPVVLDADFTGTSLADGLELVAPDLGLEELDLIHPPVPPEMLDPTGTRDARDRRTFQRARVGAPFLNDVVLHRGQQEVAFAGLWWRHDPADGVRYLPSSPARPDVEVALRWLYQPDRSPWEARFSAILRGIAEQCPEVTDVHIDLPPGMFGFTYSVFMSAGKLHGEHVAGIPFQVHRFLVTSEDRNDWVVCMDELKRAARLEPPVLAIANRTVQAADAFREDIDQRFRARLGYVGLGQRVRFIPRDDDGLGRMFRGSPAPSPDSLERVARAMKLEVRDG